MFGREQRSEVWKSQLVWSFHRGGEPLRLPFAMFVPGKRHGRIVGVEAHAFARDRNVIVGFQDNAARRRSDAHFASALDGSPADIANRVASRALMQAAANVKRGIARGTNGEGFARKRYVLLRGDLEGNRGERKDRALIGKAKREDKLTVRGADLQMLFAAMLRNIERAARGEGNGARDGGESGCRFFGVVFHGGMITEVGGIGR